MKAIYKQAGIHLPRVSFEQGRAGAPVKKNIRSLRMGDLIYFKNEDTGRWPHHVGMYLGNGYFIHCASKKGVVVESLYTSKLRKNVKNISRIVFTEKEGQILRLCEYYGLLTTNASGVYDPVTGRIQKKIGK